MSFNFPAVTYIIALVADAFLIFFSIFHVIAFDELKTDYKNPIDQCNSLNPVSVCACAKIKEMPRKKKLTHEIYEWIVFAHVK